jgi:hypothetical protein
LGIHRIDDLAASAILLFESGSVVPAITLVRATCETFALLYALHKKTQGFLNGGNPQEFDDFLMKCLVGTKRDPGDYPALNALTNIDHFEKLVPGFRKQYDWLSEFAHPNWAGLHGSYGINDAERRATIYGKNQKESAIGLGTTVLLSVLILAAHYFVHLGEELRQVNERFEGGA